MSAIEILRTACCCVALAGTCYSQDGALRTDSAAGRFDNAYQVLLDADAARDDKRFAEAASLYESARGLHLRLIDDYPEWQPGVVAFRAAYCADQVAYIIGTQAPLPAEFPLAPSGTEDATPQTVERQDTSKAIQEIRLAARQLISAGQPEDARTLLIETLSDYPDNRDIRALLASAQCHAGNYDDAVFVMQELVKEYPDDVAVRMILSSAYIGQGRCEESLKQLEQAIRIDPSIPEAYFNALQVCLTKRPPDLKEARGYYDRYLELGGEPDAAIGDTLNQYRSETPIVLPSVDGEGQHDDNDSERAADGRPESTLPVSR